MRAKFRQAVSIDGQSFGLSHDNKPMIHDVDDKITKHPHFKHFVEHGVIVAPDDHTEQEHESHWQRTKRVVGDLMKGKPHLGGLGDSSPAHDSIDDDKKIESTPVPPVAVNDGDVDEEAAEHAQEHQDDLREESAEVKAKRAGERAAHAKPAHPQKRR